MLSMLTGGVHICASWARCCQLHFHACLDRASALINVNGTITVRVLKNRSANLLLKDKNWCPKRNFKDVVTFQNYQICNMKNDFQSLPLAEFASEVHSAA